MGAFSFLCSKTHKPILSNGFHGSAVHLFLLKEGKVIEHIFGNYDNYGCVFGKDWKTDWHEICHMMHGADIHSGICAILSPFWKEGDPYPTVRSHTILEEGWGDTIETLNKETPFHRTWNI